MILDILRVILRELEKNYFNSLLLLLEMCLHILSSQHSI